MGVLKKAVIVLVAITVVVFGGSFFISPDFKVVRSIEIKASQEQVFQHIVDLKNGEVGLSGLLETQICKLNILEWQSK